jgi:hypothetical protein
VFPMPPPPPPRPVPPALSNIEGGSPPDDASSDKAAGSINPPGSNCDVWKSSASCANREAGLNVLDIPKVSNASTLLRKNDLR